MTQTRAARTREASKQRRTQKRENMQHLILDEAMRLFSLHGYEGFSLREVAEGIGYAPTTIYRYFRDKDELVFALFEAAFTEFSQTLTDARSTQAAPLAQLEAVGKAYVQFAMAHPVHYRLLFMERGDLLSPLYERLKTEGRAYVGPMIVVEILTAAQEQGVWPASFSPEEYATLIWAQVHGIASLGISCASLFSPDQVRCTMELLFNPQNAQF